MSGEAGVGRDPVLGASPGGVGAGDVGVGFPGVVPTGRISCVRDSNANGMSCPPGHAYITCGGHLVQGTLSLESSGRAPPAGDGRRWREKGDCGGDWEQGHLETQTRCHRGGRGVGGGRHLRRRIVVVQPHGPGT